MTFSIFGSGSLRNSLPIREVGSTSGWVPERTYSASSACTSTGRPVSCDDVRRTARVVGMAVGQHQPGDVARARPDRPQRGHHLRARGGDAHVDQGHLAVVVAQHEAVDVVADQRDPPDPRCEQDSSRLRHGRGAYACAMSPLQKIAMGMVIVIGSALLPGRPVARPGSSTTPSPTRSAGCSSCSGSSRWPGPTTPSTRAAGWPCSPGWSACRCGSRSCTTSSTPRASGSPRCPRSRSACSWPARSACWRAAQTPPDGYVAKRFGLLVWGFAAGRRTPGAGARRRPRRSSRRRPRAGLDAGQRRVRLLPVPGAPARVARRPGTPGDPPATSSRRSDEGRPPSS